jgi:hypothetical protein
VSIANKNWAAPSNPLEIHNESESLLSTSQSRGICLFFATGHELEEWYWAVKKVCEYQTVRPL